MKDYTSHPIYLGIDVHKKTYSLTAICNDHVIRRERMDACPKQLIAYCYKYFGKAQVFSAYEAGFCGFSLHRTLINNGIHNIVVHPASIEIAARDRVKTDKRDSAKIATQLAAGRLHSIYIPSQKREAFRSISRFRSLLVKDKTRIGVQIKSLLNFKGLTNYQKEKKFSRLYIRSLLLKKFSFETGYIIKSMIKRWFEIDLQISDVEIQLKKQAIEDQHLEKIYRSAPGVGPIASRILINELDDMSQFKNEKQLFSFTGLTPQEHSSGEHVRQGHISRQGKSILRKILVQSAWVAIKKDKLVKKTFERMKVKVGAKRAIIGVARRLIGQIRACLKKKEEYRYRKINK